MKDTGKVRINKYIASCGGVSRRGADELIKNGKVKVNGQTVTEPGFTVSSRDKVIIEGRKIEPEKKKYFIYNKPPGYITSKTDPQGRKTIYDILPPKLKDLNPAGRLDRLSTGLLILTNDGDLINRLTHPKLKVSKTYRVSVEGKVTQEDLNTLAKGIELEKDKIAYADCCISDYKKGQTTLQITLYQGINRQIRRMMTHIGHEVVSLKRLSHATMSISGLERGEYRALKPKELTNLYRYLNKKAKSLDDKK